MDNPTRFYSKLMESDVAKRLGGSVVSNSGAGLMYKGDVRTRQFLIECKTVTRPQEQITVRKEWMEKIRGEAFGQGKSYSAVAIRFDPTGRNYYLISENLMKYLIEKLEDEE